MLQSTGYTMDCRTVVNENLSAVAKIRAEPVHCCVVDAVPSIENRQQNVMVDGIEGGAEVQQRKHRHLAFVNGMHKVVVHRQYSYLRRMEGTVGWEQVVEGRTSGETFRSNPCNKLGNERRVRNRPLRAGVVGVHDCSFMKD